MYAAVCSAVAAADLRAACDLASESFLDQSGRTRSVVMTVGAEADMDWPRARAEPCVPEFCPGACADIDVS